MIRALPATALLAFGLSLTGCDAYRAPALSVASAEAIERTPDGVSILFTLDAQNDNDTQLPLREVEYRVDLDGRQIFSGTRSAEATLRRHGIQQIKLPASAPITSDTADLQGPGRYTIAGTLYYITPGQLAETLFDAGVRKPSVSFSFSGDIDLSKAVFVQPSAPAAAVEPTSSSEPTPQ